MLLWAGLPVRGVLRDGRTWLERGRQAAAAADPAGDLGIRLLGEAEVRGLEAAGERRAAKGNPPGRGSCIRSSTA